MTSRISRTSVLTWLLMLAIAVAITVPMMAMVTSTANAGDKTVAAKEAEAEESGAKEEEGDAGAAMIDEFAQEPYIKIPKIGPIDLSITKAVVYLWMAAAILIGWSIYQGKRMELRPDRKQTFSETIYELAHDQIAGSTLGSKTFGTYMPYIASLFMLIWVINLISFVPLPFGAESWLGEQGGPAIPNLALYAATSNINVTIALTIMTLGLVHYLGVKHNGPVGYLKSWAPEGNIGIQIFMWIIHAIGELVKLVSLSVRLFANMLTGHLLILVMFVIIFVIGEDIGNKAIGVSILTVPVASAFYLFEVILVATLQAYIFAVLSGVYMNGAAEPDH